MTDGNSDSPNDAEKGNSQADRIKRIAGSFDSKIETELNTIPLQVVIMGPSISGNSDALGPAAILRRDLIQRCRDIGTIVTPEHEALIEIARRRLGDGYDMATYEAHLVDHICDLLVIIPASPGSFCELGYFASLTDVCQKMIVLADSGHPRTGTYVADGPLTSARNRRAIVEYVSYRSETNKAFGILKTEIHKIRAQKSLTRVQMKAIGKE